MRQTDTVSYAPSGFTDSSGKIKEESWRGVFQHEGAHAMNVIPKIHKSRTTNLVLTIRVPWKWDYIRRSGKSG